MRARATFAALSFAGALAFCASPAFAQDGLMTVHCGQTLTHSVELANDLTNCPGNGLIIGADGITVDLNHHTIDGAVTQPSCGSDLSAVGIDNGGFDGVTIENGTVRQFDAGIRGTDVNDGRVHHLTVRDNLSGGIDFEAIFQSGHPPTGNRVDHNDVSGDRCGSAINLFINGEGNRFDHNRVHDTASGITVCCGPASASNPNVIEHNSLANIANVGIQVFSAGVAHVEHNDVAGVGSPGAGCADPSNCVGIGIGGESSGSVVNDNAVARTQNAGIDLETCFECGATHPLTDVQVSNNTLSSTGAGIWLSDTDRGVVTRNSVDGAGTFGLPSAIGVGVLLNGASNTRVSRNTITDGGAGVFGIAPGILIAVPLELPHSQRPVVGNVVERNSVSGQQADGIVVAPVAQDTTLERNTTNGNAHDGINVLSPLTTITRNTANDNGNYGIEAVPNVTDGGNNEANGNGGPAQCTTQVACS